MYRKFLIFSTFIPRAHVRASHVKMTENVAHCTRKIPIYATVARDSMEISVEKVK